MEREQASSPQLCEKGCGFFANVGCGGLCSKCHRELARATANATPTPAPKPVAVAEPATVKPSQEAQLPAEPSSAPASGEPSTSGSAEPSSKAPTRCLECKKRVGLTGFKCKCGNLFCGQHRYAESHNCPFDYKSTQREKLASSNPLVQASKVQKI